MLWRFNFASGSTLDALLSRETPPTVEELLDEQDILSECKAQNNKLVTYLSREESVRSLLTWVTSGLDELDTAADEAAEAACKKAVKSTNITPPFSADLVPAEEPKPEEFENLPLTPEALGIGLGDGLEGGEKSSGEQSRSRYPTVAAEILTSELWTIPETIMNHKDSLLKPFWDHVVPPLEKNRDSLQRSEVERAKAAFWTDEDEERERKRELIRGMWMRVNASLLQKRPTEMIRFIQSLPNVIERMVARIESPAMQDMLARIISAEEGVSDVMSWLGEQRLIPRLIDLLSPSYPSSMHVIVAELLKGIISVSAPNSSFNPHGGNAMDQTGGPSANPRDNRLVRELTDQESVQTLVGYMLDSRKLSDEDWKGLGDGPDKHAADPFVIHPLPSIASATSSLCCVCHVVVEIIRRNNSDLAEPFLFNTMRNRLMTIQSEQMRGPIAPDDDSGRKQMEDALPELADKLAIVHLGAMVAALADRFGELNDLLVKPKSAARVASAQTRNPLTMERFRIIELCAELLHSSNMATLNRPMGSGPEYSADGVLGGGLDGLDRLGQALQAGEAGEDEDDDGAGVTQARELPVSSGSTDYSLTESDDVPLSDDDDATVKRDLSPTTPTPIKTHFDHIDTDIPPPSPQDAERLRSVMEAESRTVPTIIEPTVDPSELPAGERLKHQFIHYALLPTLLDLFFEHANNNFLHHLVYDIVQQILNGNLSRGANRDLVLELFGRTALVHRVLDAQKRNDAAVAEGKPRLSYMGHISLVAEELIKFFARAPEDLLELVGPLYDKERWDAFVEGSLRETRERDTAPLAGGKPMSGLGGSMSGTSERSDSDSESDDDPGIGEPLSRTSRNDAYADAADDDGGMEFWRPSAGRAAAMDSSDDDDDDADWLRPGGRQATDEDEFGAFQSTATDLDDDDAWGAFTSVSATDAENPFGDTFAPAAAGSGGSGSGDFGSGEPLTPRDWAEAFDREFEEPAAQWPNPPEGGVSTIVVPEAGSDDDAPSSWTFAGEDHGEDLPPASPTELRAAGVDRRPSQEKEREGSASPASAAAERAAALRIADDPRDLDLPGAADDVMPALARVASAEEPLGPGVSSDTHVEGGMLTREMPDGSVIRVPEDEVALGIEEAVGKQIDKVEKGDDIEID